MPTMTSQDKQYLQEVYRLNRVITNLPNDIGVLGTPFKQTQHFASLKPMIKEVENAAQDLVKKWRKVAEAADRLERVN